MEHDIVSNTIKCGVILVPVAVLIVIDYNFA